MSGFDIIGPDTIREPRMLGEGPQIRLPGPGGPASGEGDSKVEFSSQLEKVIGQITELSDDVKGKYEALARGEPGVELHDLMTAMGKSEVAFNLMLEVRNKIVDAWQNLSRSVV